jgi:copper transport protein
VQNLSWAQVLLQLVTYIASFLTTGALGFRLAPLRGRLRPGPDRTIYQAAARRAAVLGLIGGIAGAGLLVVALAQQAARRHTDLGALLADPWRLTSVAIVAGYVLAAARVELGWWLAGLGLLADTFQGVLVGGAWTRAVNPVHVLVGGLWLGTLLVLAVAGLAPVLRDEAARARRGALVADMVNGFSPLALGCGLVLVASGLTTAWLHLHTLDALWTTTYGKVLLVKLCVVGVVFALGAWNWRRQRPRLGTEDAGRALRRSALAELAVATLVLAITSVLVTVPSPRPPRPAPASRPAD